MAHRFMLGLYRVLDGMLSAYPHLLLEGCSGGGGRFDAGMLYYSPQIWCSDDTDAIERLQIQYGTSFGYPVSTMGAHVSAVPNHQTGRVTPLATRGCVAMAGTFGYELDLNKMTEEEKGRGKAPDRGVQAVLRPDFGWQLFSSDKPAGQQLRRMGNGSKGRIQSADQCGLPACADQLRGEVCLSERTVQRCFLWAK